MTQKIVYGTDTGTYLGLDEAVVLLVPDDVDDVEEYIDEHHWDDIPQEKIGRPAGLYEFTDMVEYFVTAMHAEGVPHDTVSRIVTTVVMHAALDKRHPVVPDPPGIV